MGEEKKKPKTRQIPLGHIIARLQCLCTQAPFSVGPSTHGDCRASERCERVCFFRETKVRACQHESCEQPPAAENVNARRPCDSDCVSPDVFHSAALVSRKQRCEGVKNNADAAIYLFYALLGSAVGSIAAGSRRHSCCCCCCKVLGKVYRDVPEMDWIIKAHKINW